ncbi:MAG: sarcosine oxidase subunit gamma family protein [Henriciella sp.]|nr:sarcosine oxidase subunit gamma family protein [Henriciella sp.]
MTDLFALMPNRAPIRREALEVDEVDPVGLFLLRTRQPDDALIARIAAQTGIDLPTVPNQAVSQPCFAAWLAPNEWLVQSAEVEFHQTLTKACGDHLHHVARVDDAYVQYDLTGSKARDVLAHGSSLDFHPRVFRSNTCAQTLISGVQCLIYRAASGSRWTLFTSAAYRGHIRNWLQVTIGVN